MSDNCIIKIKHPEVWKYGRIDEEWKLDRVLFNSPQEAIKRLGRSPRFGGGLFRAIMISTIEKEKRNEPMRFTKMHGLGNDFILVYKNCEPNMGEMSELAVPLCNRHTGVGADGLVVVYSTDRADIAMRIFNADGTIAEQCGNAVRCVAKYYYERISARKEEITIETKIGVQTVWLQAEDGRVQQVRVDMGEPVLKSSEIPVRVEADRAVNKEIDVEGKTFVFTGVSMGNPHAVIEVEDATSFPVETWGPLLETHPLFPHKANIEFITIHSPEEVTMRVWERGVGQTFACGSGACATVVAGVLTSKLNRRAVVHLKGGDLHIEWNQDDNHVYMTGPATFVFEGEWQVTEE